MLGFCQNWIFGQKFDFSNSVSKRFSLADMDLSQSILNVIDSSAGDKDKGSKVKQQKMLSFKQFVTFLIRGSREATMDPLLSRKEHFNTHWFPYWKLCSPCHPHTLPNTIVKLDEGQFQQEVGTHCLKITQNVAFQFF